MAGILYIRYKVIYVIEVWFYIDTRLLQFTTFSFNFQMFYDKILLYKIWVYYLYIRCMNKYWGEISMAVEKENWQKFEESAFNYVAGLCEEVSAGKKVPIIAKPLGGHDSTKSDIVITKGGKEEFYIETKFSPAQSGQFSVIDTGEKFEFSQGNKTHLNKNVEKILEYINVKSRYDTIKNSESNNYYINCDPNDLREWVTNHYQKKCCKFIITSKQIDGYKAIIPLTLADLAANFVIKACLRPKRSGSRALPQGDLAEAESALEAHLRSMGNSFTTSQDGKRTIATLSVPSKFKRDQKLFGNEAYVISRKSDSIYEIRKRGTTNNKNVIFELTYDKDLVQDEGRDLLKAELESLYKG